MEGLTKLLTLHITQSAVSQRVKLLEEQMGQILLARTNLGRSKSVKTLSSKMKLLSN
jgi:hypothetical protein